jgi:DUF4097 and DUF4098 domain-containing protein YvlB
MSLLAATVVTLLAMPGHTDTTLSVHTGARLEVSNFVGGVSVSSWDRNEVRIQADHSTRTRVELENRATGLKISSVGERGTPGDVEYHITAPSWMALDITGPVTDVDVDGSRGDVKVETVKGDVSVKGGNGFLELSSVQGDISVEGAKGRLKLNSINQDVTATRISGQLEAETVNGDLVLDDVQLDALDASSVSGSLWFNGTLKNDGRYQLHSHSGDIEVVAPDHPDAAVSVSTFSGDFSSDFDVTFNGTRGHRELQFTLGSGGAQLDLESFSGNIRLLKAATVQELRARLRAHPAARDAEKSEKLKEKAEKDKEKAEKEKEKAEKEKEKIPQ